MVFAFRQNAGEANMGGMFERKQPKPSYRFFPASGDSLTYRRSAENACCSSASSNALASNAISKVIIFNPEAK